MGDWLLFYVLRPEVVRSGGNGHQGVKIVEPPLHKSTKGAFAFPVLLAHLWKPAGVLLLQVLVLLQVGGTSLQGLIKDTSIR